MSEVEPVTSTNGVHTAHQERERIKNNLLNAKGAAKSETK